MEDDVDQVGRAPVSFGEGHRVNVGEDKVHQQGGGRRGFDTEVISVALDDLGEGREDRGIRLGDVPARPRWVRIRLGAGRHEDTHQRSNALTPDRQDAGCCFELRIEREVGVDSGKGFLNRYRVHADLDGLDENGRFVREDAEHRALCDAGGRCHLAGCDGRAPFEKKGDHGLRNRAAAIVGGKWLGSPVFGVHRAIITE